MSVTPEAPQSREEKWLAVIAGVEGIEPEEPQSRIEKWLAYIAEHGAGSLTPEQQAALDSGITAALVALIPPVELSHETWVFTLGDGTTVEKEITLWT